MSETVNKDHVKDVVEYNLIEGINMLIINLGSTVAMKSLPFAMSSGETVSKREAVSLATQVMAVLESTREVLALLIESKTRTLDENEVSDSPEIMELIEQEPFIKKLEAILLETPEEQKERIAKKIMGL